MNEDFIKELKKSNKLNLKTASEELGSDVSDIYPFDIPNLDIILGGGLYSGKIIEIFGWESQGKSTFGLEAAKAFTRYWDKKGDDNYAILWIETESALDKVRATWMGCPIDRFLIAEAETVEEGFDTIEMALEKSLKTGIKLFIVWDTIGATQTLNEKTEGKFCFPGDAKVKCLDGKVRTMEEMTEDFNKGIKLWTYSYDTEKDQVVPGEVIAAGITATADTLIKLTFDNGESQLCSPDHLWMLRNKTFNPKVVDVGGIRVGIYNLYQRMLEQELTISNETWNDNLKILKEKKIIKKFGGTTISTVIKLFGNVENIKKCSPTIYKKAKDIEPGDSLMPLYYRQKYEEILSPENIYTHWMVKRDIPEGYCRHHNVWNPQTEMFDIHDNNPEHVDVIPTQEHRTIHTVSQNRRAKNSQTTSKRNSDPDFINLCKKGNTVQLSKQRSNLMKRLNKEGVLKTVSNPDHCDKINRSKILNRAKNLVLNKGLAPTKEYYLSTYKRSRPPTAESAVLSRFGSWENMFEQAKYYNHSVVSKEWVKLDKEIPLYDIEVKNVNNFALELNGSCIFVHNSGGIAEKARIIRYYLRRVVSSLGATNSTFIIVNQAYKIIGSYVGGDESPGGGGIKFHSSVRAKLTKKSEIKRILPNGEEITEGIMTDFFTIKNKLVLPKQHALVAINGERGFDKFTTVVSYLSKTKTIRVAGSWKYLTFPTKKGKEEEEIAFQSIVKLKELLADRPDVIQYMDYLVYKSYTEASPLMKVKIIDKVWEFEKQFFGKKVTTLTDEEVKVAKLLHKKLVTDDMTTDAKERKLEQKAVKERIPKNL